MSQQRQQQQQQQLKDEIRVYQYTLVLKRGRANDDFFERLTDRNSSYRGKLNVTYPDGVAMYMFCSVSHTSEDFRETYMRALKERDVERPLQYVGMTLLAWKKDDEDERRVVGHL